MTLGSLKKKENEKTKTNSDEFYEKWAFLQYASISI